MSDSTGKILVMALIFDACSNIARLFGVWAAMRHQESVLRRAELENDRRVASAATIVADIVKATVAEIREAAE